MSDMHQDEDQFATIKWDSVHRRKVPSSAYRRCSQLLDGKHYYTQLTREELEAAPLDVFLLLMHGYLLAEDRYLGAMNGVEDLLYSEKVGLDRLLIADHVWREARKQAEEEVRGREDYSWKSEQGELLGQWLKRHRLTSGPITKQAEQVGKKYESDVKSLLNQLGINPRREMTPAQRAAQTKDIDAFGRRLRTEMLRRQWREVTYYATAVRYVQAQTWKPDAKWDQVEGRIALSPLSLQQPDGSWIETSEGLGCEEECGFEAEVGMLLLDTCDPGGLFNWDQREVGDSHWTLVFRDGDKNDDPTRIPMREDFEGLSDAQTSRALSMAMRDWAQVEHLFDRWEFSPENRVFERLNGWGWMYTRLSAFHGPASRKASLLSAERLRRLVKGRVPRGATALLLTRRTNKAGYETNGFYKTVGQKEDGRMEYQKMKSGADLRFRYTGALHESQGLVSASQGGLILEL